MRRPLTTLPRFINAHIEVDRSLKEYKLTKRGKKLSEEAFRALSDHASLSLKATNAKARIEVAKAADIRLKKLLKTRAFPNQLFWITITPVGLTYPAHSASSFLPVYFRSHIAGIFEGVDYFGMIDIAYYPRRRNGLVGHERRFYLAGPLVSYHAHLLAWNCSEEEIERLKNEMNQLAESLFPNRLLFHYRPISAKKAAGKNLYQLKGPVTAYSAYSELVDTVRSATGEFVRRPDPGWTIKKRELRPGEAAEIHNVASQFTIPELMLGGGQGLKLKRKVLEMAQAQLISRYQTNLGLLGKKLTNSGAPQRSQ